MLTDPNSLYIYIVNDSLKSGVICYMYKIKIV